jgi:hypothetical protein
MVQFLARAGNFIFTTTNRLARAHSLIQWVLGALSFWAKWQKRKANHSPLPSPEAKNALHFTFTTSYIMKWFLNKGTLFSAYIYNLNSANE